MSCFSFHSCQIHISLYNTASLCVNYIKQHILFFPSFDKRKTTEKKEKKLKVVRLNLMIIVVVVPTLFAIFFQKETMWQ